MIRIARLLLVFFSLAAPALTASPENLPVAERAKTAMVVDADTIRLEGGAVDVRLVGMQGPKLPLGRKGFHTWPLASDARDALIKILEGHAVTLRLAVTPRDRNGRILAHVIRDDGLWVQAEMVRLGWARVYTFPDNRQFADELYAAEREARAARRGIWSNAFYAVRAANNPDVLKHDIGTFQVIEGKVVNATKVRGRVYINFGADYRTDFTVTIASEALKVFTAAKLDPLSLKDKVIRVRGYVRDYRGPEIELSHPEQIETGLQGN